MKSYPFALPTMPPLPKERVRRHAPFQSIGVDFLGPTLTYLAGEKVKVWILLISCLATRAVHLEAMLNTTAEAFLNVLRRFISRRGKPDLIWSDNTTTFKLADKTLDLLTSPGDGVQEFLALNRIRWRFIPQISPWAGGFYERLVKLCKDCFRRTLGRRILAYDDLNTFVAEVEATLNHRPITFVSDLEDGPMPLRPINLIHPEIKVIWDTTSERFDDEDPDAPSHHLLAARVQALQEANEVFWTKWYQEYLLLLRERSGWDHKGPRLQNHNQPQEGMIVLVKEDLAPRNQWPIGRITKLHGHPGSIRSVSVEVPIHSPTKKLTDLPRKSVLVRPINRIFPLEAGPEITEKFQIPYDQTGKVPLRTLDPHLEQESPDESENTSDNVDPKQIDSSQSNHQMTTRRRAGMTSINSSFTILCLTLICLPWLILGGKPNRQRRYPIEQCNDCIMECRTLGVFISVPPEIQMFEICCESSCTTQHDILSFHHFVSKDILRHPHICKGTFWTEPHRAFFTNISCPESEECELLDCTLCVDQLSNPTCQPWTSSLVATGSMALFFAFLIFIYISIKLLLTAWWMATLIFIPFRRRSRRRPIEYEEDGEELLEFPRRKRARSRARVSRNWTIRQLSRPILLALLFLPKTQGTMETVAIMAKSENCIRNAFDLTCSIESTATLTLLPAGQVNTLLIQTEDGRELGSIQVTLRTLTLDCQDFTMRWLRSYHIATASSKRCPTAGSCNEDFCTKVRPNTSIHELREVSDYPGFNFCKDSPAFWGNHCLFGGPQHGACLFYRWFAKPRSSTPYELIGCNTWEFGVFAFFQMDSAIGKTGSVETILRPGKTMKMNNVSFSLIGVSHPPAPLLNANFLFGRGKMALIREPLPDILYCPDLKAAHEFNCSLSIDSCSDCFPDHQDGSVTCECRSLNLEKLIDDPQRTLPLNFYHHHLRNMGRKVFAIVSYSPIQIHLKLDKLRVALEHNDAMCTVTPKNLSGCFKCAGGARFDFDCQTDRGITLAEINCQDGTRFSSKCGPTEIEHVKYLPFDSSEIHTECQVICKAGPTKFTLQGLLHTTPREQLVNFDTNKLDKIEEQNDISWFNFNFNLDWKSILWTLLDGKSILIIAIAVISILLVIKILIPLKLWTLLSYLAVSQSLCSNFTLGTMLAGGSSYGERSSQNAGLACPTGMAARSFVIGALPIEKIEKSKIEQIPYQILHNPQEILAQSSGQIKNRPKLIPFCGDYPTQKAGLAYWTNVNTAQYKKEHKFFISPHPNLPYQTPSLQLSSTKLESNTLPMSGSRRRQASPTSGWGSPSETEPLLEQSPSNKKEECVTTFDKPIPTLPQEQNWELRPLLREGVWSEERDEEENFYKPKTNFNPTRIPLDKIRLTGLEKILAEFTGQVNFNQWIVSPRRHLVYQPRRPPERGKTRPYGT